MRISEHFDASSTANIVDCGDFSLKSITKFTQICFNRKYSASPPKWISYRIEQVSPDAFDDLENVQTLVVNFQHLNRKTQFISLANLLHLECLTILNIAASSAHMVLYPRLDLNMNQSETLTRVKLNQFEIDVRMFKHLRHLNSLDLTLCKLCYLGNPDAFFGLSELRHLDLSNCNLETIPPESFAHLSGLETLYLNENDLTELGPNTFDRLSNLKILSLTDAGLTAIKPNLFKNLTKLSELALDNNELTHLEPDAFEALISLESLDLSQNGLKTLEPELFATNKRLSYLNLGKVLFITDHD